MAKVFYIPYAKYELQSDLSKEELITQVRSQLSNHNIIGEWTAKKKGKFSGAINSKTGEFQIRKRLDHRNHFNSTLKGQIVESNNGSKILITLRLPTFTYIFIIAFSLIWALFWLLMFNSLEDLIWPIGGLTFIYFLTFFGFNMGAGSALDSLYELV